MRKRIGTLGTAARHAMQQRTVWRHGRPRWRGRHWRRLGRARRRVACEDAERQAADVCVECAACCLCPAVGCVPHCEVLRHAVQLRWDGVVAVEGAVGVRPGGVDAVAVGVA